MTPETDLVTRERRNILVMFGPGLGTTLGQLQDHAVARDRFAAPEKATDLRLQRTLWGTPHSAGPGPQRPGVRDGLPFCRYAPSTTCRLGEMSQIGRVD